MSYGDLLSEAELQALDEVMRIPNAPPSVLLVDDDEAGRDALADELIAKGKTEEGAEAGKEGEKKGKE